MKQKSCPSIALIVPIYNAEKDIPELLPAIFKQTVQPHHILFIDSSSDDQSQKLLSQLDANHIIKVHTIEKNEFDHGGTRRLATQLIEADIYIYLTQDAVPANEHAFKHLLDLLLANETIACAYGRQLPKSDATPIAAHARLFNYPDQSSIKIIADKAKFGIKTFFNSNSFAAYKRVPLEAIGNFPEHFITGEDAYVAAKLLTHGYSICYAANALVFHSHNLSVLEEFHRYFSIGVFHNREKWLLNEFAYATGEGRRFVQSELKYLIAQKQFHWLPRAVLSTFVKYAAYQLGMHEYMIPHCIKKKFGINKSFWLKTKAVF